MEPVSADIGRGGRSTPRTSHQSVPGPTYRDLDCQTLHQWFLNNGLKINSYPQWRDVHQHHAHFSLSNTHLLISGSADGPMVANLRWLISCSICVFSTSVHRLIPLIFFLKSWFPIYCVQRWILLNQCGLCAFQKGVGCSEWRRGPHTGTQTHRQDCQLH